MTRKKRYDAELKRQVAKVYLDGRRTGANLAEELGVHINTIYKWGEQYRDDPDNAFRNSDATSLDDELEVAKQRVRELEEEVEVLRKTVAYFAKNAN
ncbi:MAG: transposase [Oscillospiraceae bacterium]|nr:transposase [Oscillospiraceae bacterium]MCL2278553.1 transposase [Oscillospiraceae bacterium]